MKNDDNSGAAQPGRAPLVVLVEDNENDELLARAALKATGIAAELLVARDGEEALDVLLERGSHAADAGPRRRPALVLLDLNLPRLDGHEVLRRLQQDARARRLPVVVLSSSTEERDLVRAYELGARSYVCKPIEFEEFVSAMRVILSYWLTINVPPPPVP